MAKITPERVARLAERTGLSKKDCRELLEGSDGDVGMAKFMADTLRTAAQWEREDRAAKSKRLKDPVFGSLSWKHQWAGKSAARTLGAKPALTVESADAAPPDERQREAYRLFLKHERSLARPLKEASFHYYQKTRKRWAKDEGAAFLDEVMPAVSSADDVAAMLSHPSVHVPKQPRRGWEVRVRWHCAWDEEHGHETTVRDGEVKRAGRAGG